MEPLFLRALERIIGVLIGGFAIYLGYQLFMHLPTQMNSEGKVVLPGNISVYLSRVGPGAFFALFGTVVVAASFYFQLKASVPGQATISATEASSGGVAYQYMTGTGGINDKQNMEAARSQRLSDIRTLNKLHARLSAQSQGDVVLITAEERTDLILAIPRFNLAMLSLSWEKNWGDYASFARWVKSGAGGRPPQGTEKAASLFREQ